MDKRISQVVIAGLLAVGMFGCTSHRDTTMSSDRRDALSDESRTGRPMVPVPATIEGTVSKQTANEIWVKDTSGREYRLLADNATRRDSNITVGDRVVARTSTDSTSSANNTYIHADSIMKR